jgi:hypothetical protein
VAPGGVGVVVVGVRPRCAEPGGLLVVDEAEADAHLDAGVLGLDLADRLGDPLDLAGAGTVSRCHQADPSGPAADPGLDGVMNVLGVGPRVGHDVGQRAETLRAVGAVLRAQAALEIHQVVQPHPVGEEAAADLPGRGDHRQQLGIAAAQHLQRLLAGGGLPLQTSPGHLD